MLKDKPKFTHVEHYCKYILKELGNTNKFTCYKKNCEKKNMQITPVIQTENTNLGNLFQLFL